MKKIVLVYSGGLDSTVLLHFLVHNKNEVKTLTFDYGSRHNEREYECAKKNCDLLGIENKLIKLDFIKDLFNSALLKGGEAIPDGHYQDEVMRKTVVPFRNGIMLSIAAGYAESIDYEMIALANHAGDHAIYPDCTPNFNFAMMKAIVMGTYKKIVLYAPFCKSTKKRIVAIGKELGVPFENTYSCYKGGDIHCGTCGTCVERKEAFLLNNIEDGVIYEN